MIFYKDRDSSLINNDNNDDDNFNSRVNWNKTYPVNGMHKSRSEIKIHHNPLYIKAVTLNYTAIECVCTVYIQVNHSYQTPTTLAKIKIK